MSLFSFFPFFYNFLDLKARKDRDNIACKTETFTAKKKKRKTTGIEESGYMEPTVRTRGFSGREGRAVEPYLFSM